MTALVVLDTETGVISRFDGRIATHAAGLTHDPEDADRSRVLLEQFRVNPHADHKIKVPRKRTIDDALREQRERLRS